MTWVGVAVALAAAGASYYNTQQTAKKQDNALADSLVNQGRKQKELDTKVNEEVEKLKTSTSDSERRDALQSYMSTLQKNKPKTDAGLNPTIGSGVFQADSAQAAGDVQSYAANTADMMSRVDAAGMQRQGEAFDYGRLGTDVGMLAREAKGQAYLDELRLRGIRRNPWIDAAAAGASAYAGAYTGGAGGGGGNYGAPATSSSRYYGTGPP